MVKIAPSLLAADWGNLAQELKRVEEADLIHIDIMDGAFVPNLTFGPYLVETVRRLTPLPLDVHLMVKRPERMLADFLAAGADYLTVHVEATPNLHRVLQEIVGAGKKAGVALNPGTPAVMVEPVLSLVDLVLVMTVNPGFGGQEFLPEVLPKITTVRDLLARSRPGCLLAVDGGINRETAPLALAAGADTLVAGTALFGEETIDWAVWRGLRPEG